MDNYVDNDEEDGDSDVDDVGDYHDDVVGDLVPKGVQHDRVEGNDECQGQGVAQHKEARLDKIFWNIFA